MKPVQQGKIADKNSLKCIGIFTDPDDGLLVLFPFLCVLKWKHGGSWMSKHTANSKEKETSAWLICSMKYILVTGRLFLLIAFCVDNSVDTENGHRSCSRYNRERIRYHLFCRMNGDKNNRRKCAVLDNAIILTFQKIIKISRMFSGFPEYITTPYTFFRKRNRSKERVILQFHIFIDCVHFQYFGLKEGVC